MKIYFFGHSATKGRMEPIFPKTFFNLVYDYFSLPNSVNILENGDYEDGHTLSRGFIKCSEERILFFLKKTKIDPENDIVIIFHGDPNFVFCPSLDHDFRNSAIDKWDRDYYEEKDKNFIQYENFKDKLPKDYYEGTDINWRDVETLLNTNLKNFYHIDLQFNRYYGALIQIDQYLRSRKIPVIHCIHKEYIPSWFKFSSGIVDTELIEIQYNSDYSISYAKSSNGINEEGNKIIANKLTKYIKKYRKCAIEFQ